MQSNKHQFSKIVKVVVFFYKKKKEKRKKNILELSLHLRIDNSQLKKE
jgi:hypothetical protein